MDSRGDFCPQRAKAAAKTLAKASWVLRMFATKDLSTMRTLWKSLVQPHQDYASQLWAPVGLLGDLRAQEAPLRAYTRRIRGLGHLTYWERLRASGLSSMERQQDRYMILYIFKILKGLVPNCGITLDPRQETRRGLLVTIPPLAGTRAAVCSL